MPSDFVEPGRPFVLNAGGGGVKYTDDAGIAARVRYQVQQFNEVISEAYLAGITVDVYYWEELKELKIEPICYLV